MSPCALPRHEGRRREAGALDYRRASREPRVDRTEGAITGDITPGYAVLLDEGVSAGSHAEDTAADTWRAHGTGSASGPVAGLRGSEAHAERHPERPRGLVREAARRLAERRPQIP